MDKIFLILLIITIFLSDVSSQIGSKNFDHISVNTGLSHDNVYAIAQDNQGFLWFGTEEGLNKYDGKTLDKFYNNPNDENSLSSSNFGKIVIENDSIIWFGTYGGGIDMYNTINRKFTHYSHDPEDPNSLSDNSIDAIFKSSDGTIYFGTAYGGLNKLIYTEKGIEFKSYDYDANNPNSISNSRAKIICEDKNGSIWIGTTSGLNKFNPKTETFTRFYNDKNNLNTISSDRIHSLYCDEDNILWIGTRGNGLNKLDLNTYEITHYYYDENNLEGISDNNIEFIYEDSFGYLWLGTYSGGLNKFDKKTGKTIVYKHNEADLKSLSYNRIETIFEDASQILWVGTRGGGINKLDLKPEKFNNLIYNPLLAISLPNSSVYAITANNPDSILIGTDGGGLAYYNRITETYTVYNTSNTNLKSNRIWSLLIDNNQNIWVGTHQGGLTLFQKKGDEYISSTFENSLTDENLIVGVTVNDIFQDTNGNIWIGTDLGFNKVIFIKNKVSFQKFKSIFEDNTTISENYVTSICEDKDKNLWIGTSFGLNKYVIEENKFYRYFHDIKDSTSLNNDYITTLYIDLNGNLWIGTKGGGINLFNKTTNSFSNYTENDGLINNSIKAITEDKSGNLWISTSFGLSQFDFKNRTFKNYDNKHGLISTGFNYNSVYQASDGELFFGSISGLSYFYPDKIVDNPNKPKIIIKDIKISNYSIFNDVKNEIYKQLINNSTLVFDYTQNIISFDFIAMDFTNPEGNLYAYYLENFEEKWNYSGNRNYVTYTNLKPGNYTLKIKAANSDGIWNEEGIEIKIKILPPFWETWFFRIFVFLFVLITIISIYRLRVRKIKIQNKKFEDQVKQRTAEVEQQKEEIKAQSETLIIANEELQKLSFVASKTDNAVTILDPEGNLEWINEGFSRLYGYTFEEVINSWGKNIREFSSNEKIISLIENCILSKKSVVYEGQLESKSGNKIWAQTTLTPILDEKNNVTKLITIDTDITKIIDAEKEITRQRDEIKEQTEQLNSINEMLFANNLEIDERNKLIEEKNLEIEKAYTDFKLLSTLGQEITTFLDEQKIYDTLIKNINVFFDVDLFKIGLYNQSNNSLEFHTTIDKGNLSQLYSISLNEENNLAVVCFNNNQDVIINDFDLEYKFYILKDLPTSNEEKTTSIIYLPLTSKEKKLGVISIQNFNRNAYKEQHINVLRNLALYISIALDNSSVYKKVEIQKNEIQKKNRDITDSINYAKRIQNAILQRPEFLITNNQEFFIMYKPKQIISGDFYWFKEISSVEFICIVADCTGHGVPGAFMSMLGIAFLNEIISQNINISTSVVLNLLRKKVKSSLKQTGKDKESRDGMDISIVKINKKYKTLQFSGAFNTIFLIQNGIMIKPVADKMPIGIYQIETDFTHEDFNIETGDVLYMFSDGFADQFGEKTNRRFLFKNFISVINEIYLQPMHEQHLILNSTLIEWQGREPQLDDILIFGIRLEV